MKTTTLAVLFANATTVFRRRKHAEMFGRRIDDGTVKSASTILVLYLTLALVGACIISVVDGISLERCLFETASAVATVGLSLGLTPALGALSRGIIIVLILVSYLLLSLSGDWTQFCDDHKINKFMLPIYLLIDQNLFNEIYLGGYDAEMKEIVGYRREDGIN